MSGGRPGVRSLAGRVLPPLAVFAGVVVLWHLAVVAFKFQPYLVPTPMMVLRTAREDAGTLLMATGLTASGAVCGLLLSIVAGLLVSFAFSQSRLVQRCFYPYAIFLQTVPIVAIAPLVITWFGQGFASVVLVSFIISLFPIITNGTAGLTDVDPDLLELFAIHNASRAQVLLRLRFPNSVPYLVNGIRISSGLSVIGAIVGEFFASYGRDRFGLGYLIQSASGLLDTALLFAAILASTLLGLAIFGAVTMAGSLLTRRWKEAG
jgi:NitT/TauT family transport system permease protein